MDTKKIIDIFNNFDISSIKDENQVKFSSLGSVTNLNYKVEINEKKICSTSSRKKSRFDK